VLFIHHDDAKVFHRSEDSGARADNDLCLSREYVAPVLPPLVWFEAAVKNGDPLTEPALESVEKLRGQCYLRDHHERGAALFQRLDNELKVDLCLTASCDTVE
jgi:hypothetical protein